MTDIGAAKSGTMNIGEEAKPPFTVLPDPVQLFHKRSKRLSVLAVGHQLASYLSFLSALTEAQHAIVPDLPPAQLPAPDAIALRLANGMPPLGVECLTDSVAETTLAQYLTRAARLELPEAAKITVKTLQNAMPELRSALMADIAGSASTVGDLAQRTLVAAALQVHAARLASQLVADDLKPISDGVCPVCGSPPASSAVVGWPSAHNTRYCLCSLCGTHWNVVRVKCALCGDTSGVAYHTIDGQPDVVKAESCDECKRYLKINYQVHQQDLEGIADDVASLGLDMLMRDAGWIRGGHNPFLEGY